MKKDILKMVAVAFAVAGVLAAVTVPAFAQEGEAATEHASKEMHLVQTNADAMTLMGAFIAASFCTAVSVLGASWAVAKVGTAAMGAVAEKPELMGRSMVYVGLAEGLAIYGLIVAILILFKV